MNKISISKCVNGAWDLTTKNWIMCIIVLVATILVSFISSSTTQTVVYDSTNMTPEEALAVLKSTLTASFGVATLVAYIVQYAIYAGLFKMAINGYHGLKVDTTAYQMPFATYVKFIGACIVYGILISIGLIFCIIPGLFIAVRFMFATIILLDEPETEFIDAFKKSWAMTSGNFWSLFGLGIMVILINLAGLLCCCIGIIFTAVMSMFMAVIAYYMLKNTPDTEEVMA